MKDPAENSKEKEQTWRHQNMIKIAWYWQKDMSANSMNRTENSEINLCIQPTDF